MTLPTRRLWKHSANSIVLSPPIQSGGVKSLYSVCEWLNDVGRSTILPFGTPVLASWFEHRCQLYDDSYDPDIVIYPEAYQPRISGRRVHVCFALGKYKAIEAHADLTVCRSPELLRWVKEQHLDMPAVVVPPSINRAVFEYDGRPKEEIICYMTRAHKHPEMAQLLRDRYRDRVVEIVNLPEAAVATVLKSAKVFVWRGNKLEGSPRPPKEALVAGCVVVGLESDLHERYCTNFGIRCANVEEVIHMAGEALKMSGPTAQERSVVRGGEEEKRDWIALLRTLMPGNES